MASVKRSVPSSSLRHDAEETAAVFPALMVEAERVAASLISGIHGRKQSGSGETFWQHRPYAFGDSFASIDWRQSARNSNRLFVRENEWEAAAGVWLWRDPTASMVYASSPSYCQKRHRANVLSVASALLLARGGERIGVLLSANAPHNAMADGGTRLFHGKGAPTRVMEHLDHSIIDGQDHLPFSDRIKPGHRVILISDFLIDPLIIGEGLSKLTARGARGVVCQVLDPAEREFPFRGRKEFIDTETDDRLLFGNTGSLKSTYQREFAAHQDALTSVCKKTGWPLITHTTRDNARDGLLSLFDSLTPGRG